MRGRVKVVMKKKLLEKKSGGQELAIKRDASDQGHAKKGVRQGSLTAKRRYEGLAKRSDVNDQ